MDDLGFLPDDQATLDGAMFAGESLAEFAPQSDAAPGLRGPPEPYAAGTAAAVAAVRPVDAQELNSRVSPPTV